MSERREGAADRPLDPVLDFLRVLWTLEHSLQSASKRMGVSLGVTGPQRLALKVVTRFPGVAAGELSEILHLHPSTVTGIVQRLVAKGLLVRNVNPQDRRRVRLEPRARAKAFTRSAEGTVESAVIRTLRTASPDHVRHAREVLARLTDALDRLVV